MGGLGSGGHNARKRGAVEAHRRLSANSMQKAGVFREGWSGRWGWSADDGETANWIWVKGGEDEIRLDFKLREGSGEWQPVNQTVTLTRVPKPFGSGQPYFLCSRCGCRALHLYGSQARFLCRKCSGLVHACTRERHSDRATRQAHKIKRRLGAELGMDDPAFRPRHMRHTTYEKLHTRLEQKEAESWDDMLLLLQRLQKSTGRTSSRRSRTPSHGRRRSAFW